MKRREFVQAMASGLLLGARQSQAQSPPPQPSGLRMEWSDFKKDTVHFPAFLATVRKMRDNTDVSNPESWDFWVAIHDQHGQHGGSYFLEWHRGFLYHFERQLRKSSGVPTLSLPYWDYMKTGNAGVPAEFSDPNGPLCIEGRSGKPVDAALCLDAFDAQIKNFPRDPYNSNTFEEMLEDRPHNLVHNLIGGTLACPKTAPKDPLFWLHHANLDRLWVAWVHAGQGRSMPDDDYWQDSATLTQLLYGDGLNLDRKIVASIDGLGYSYADISLPQRAPGSLSFLLNTLKHENIAELRSLSTLGSEMPLRLGAASYQLDLSNFPLVRPFAAKKGRARAQTRHIELLLDGVKLIGNGSAGGYSYLLYLDAKGIVAPSGHAAGRLLGSLGPFSVIAAGHHHSALAADNASCHFGDPQNLRFTATQALQGLSTKELHSLTLYFIRIGGDAMPAGDANVVEFAGARIESAV